MPLQPTAPCFFLRRGGKVQNFAYSDVKADFVVIIAGTELSDAKRKTWNLKQGEVCGEAAQAVLQTAGQVRTSKSVHSGGVYCRDQGVDEKDFFSFAHDPEYWGRLLATSAARPPQAARGAGPAVHGAHQ